MNEKICPECGVVYTNGQRECEQCEKLLRNATEEELAEYEKKMKKKLGKASNSSESIIPELWQIIFSAVLLLYGIFVLIVCGKTTLLIFNTIFVFSMLIPNFAGYFKIQNPFNIFARDHYFIRVGKIIILSCITVGNIIYSVQIF